MGWRARVLRRILRVAGRPARRDAQGKGVVIQPYRGYGTPDEVFLMGRVFRQSRLGATAPAGSLRRELADVSRRFTRWGLGRVPVRACFAGDEKTFLTDRDGYFHVALQPAEPVDRSRCWHRVPLEVAPDHRSVRDDGEVFIPPPSASIVVVSDIDDTVMWTGVASKIRMFWTLFAKGAESRVPFPGVTALYRALHAGPSGRDRNPMLYVSRGPWSIYEVLEEFFRIQRIPEGPVLFLREWGLTFQRPLPRRATRHKQELIEDMLGRYGDLPFVLIGDSGQHDPEVYAEIVHRHPGRVRAVYIRDVSEGPSRADEIEALRQEAERSGTPLVLASDSAAMAEHARRAGLISQAACLEVVEERQDPEYQAQ